MVFLTVLSTIVISVFVVILVGGALIVNKERLFGISWPIHRIGDLVDEIKIGYANARIIIEPSEHGRGPRIRITKSITPSDGFVLLEVMPRDDNEFNIIQQIVPEHGERHGSSLQFNFGRRVSDLSRVVGDVVSHCFDQQDSAEVKIRRLGHYRLHRAHEENWTVP